MSGENNTGGTAAAENASAVSADSSTTAGDAAGGTTAGMVELPLGEALTLVESLPITRAQRAQLVVIAGAVGSGKTTLIAVLFHLFQRGEFEGYFFAGSETLVGFDQRCYLARTASGRPKADTARTRPGEERQLLHLRVRRHDLATPACDILLSDLSGEDYREAKNSVEECRRLPLLGRADHFVLLINAHQLTQLDCRQKTRNEATSLLRTCLDAGQLGKFSYVDVLLSRWDLVNQGDPETMSFITELEKLLEQQFAHRVNRLRYARIAARPHPGSSYSLGYGLDVVFPSWVEDHYVPACHSQPFARPDHYAAEFDRYLERRLTL